MNVEFINPFLKSTASVFTTMLACNVERGDPSLREDAVPNYDVTGIIGLSGGATGTVVVSLDKDVALNATEALLGSRPDTIDADVVDAVGELTNMIAGQAKSELEKYQMQIALPTVITGRNHAIQFESSVKPIRIPFNTEWGPLSVEVGLTVQKANLATVDQ